MWIVRLSSPTIFRNKLIDCPDSIGFTPNELSNFGMACFYGAVEEVQKVGILFVIILTISDVLIL